MKTLNHIVADLERESRMFRCDLCDKPLADYLYGYGGVASQAIIINKNLISTPDIICHECNNLKNNIISLEEVNKNI